MRYARTIFIPCAFSFLLALTLNPNSASAQSPMSPEDEAIYRNMIKSTGLDPQMVMEAKRNVDSAQRWTKGKDGIVHYHIVGEYQARTNVVGGSNWIGYADVSDHVVINLDWKISESEFVGTPSFTNTKSVVTNLRNSEPSCLPPILKGDYEHFELLAVNQGLGGTLELQVQTNYPTVEVAQFCSGSRKTVPASTETEPVEMVVPSPMMLTMQLPDSDSLRISPDKRSLIRKDAGWTWTFTPSVD